MTDSGRYHERGPIPQRYLTAKGRAGRLEYNVINIGSLALMIVGVGVIDNSGLPAPFAWFTAMFAAAGYVGICATARRCHDFNRSLAHLTPAGVPGERNPWNFRMLAFSEGDPRPNDYGPPAT